MSFHEKYDFSLLINQKERSVIDELEHQLTVRTEVCRCDECVLDMVTLALNNCKPVYRVTLMGSIFAGADDSDHHQEIERAVAVAIGKIFENPSHARATS